MRLDWKPQIKVGLGHPGRKKGSKELTRLSETLWLLGIQQKHQGNNHTIYVEDLA